MGELRLHKISYYIDKYDLSTFIETGTGKGEGLSYALQHDFKEYWSIEINRQLFVENKKIFHTYLYDNNFKLNLVNRSSIEALKNIFDSFNIGRTFFWLDAHFPGADFQLGSYEDDYPKNIKTPLESEVEIISQMKETSGDVIMIDDLGLYEDGDYEINTKKMKELRDFLKLDISFIYDIFSKTHQIFKNYRHQGFLILEPKENHGM